MPNIEKLAMQSTTVSAPLIMSSQSQPSHTVAYCLTQTKIKEKIFKLKQRKSVPIVDTMNTWLRTVFSWMDTQQIGKVLKEKRKLMSDAIQTNAASTDPLEGLSSVDIEMYRKFLAFSRLNAQSSAANFAFVASSSGGENKQVDWFC